MRRSNKAHKQMTNMWFPGMNPELIERADHRRIDNPTGKDMMLSKAKRKYFANKSGFLPGMWVRGHSQFNHDALTIMIRAAQKDVFLALKQALLTYYNNEV